jgi:hypothetical protein
MSLDVHLTGPPEEKTCHCSCGNEHKSEEREYFFDANITHNLGEMARAAGIYMPLWRPEEVGITKAKQLIIILREGYIRLKDDPKRYEKYNAKNGWGEYKHFLPWVLAYMEACVDYPEADVEVSR